MALRIENGKTPKVAVTELENALRAALSQLQVQHPDLDITDKLESITDEFFTVPCTEHISETVKAGEWAVEGEHGKITGGQVKFPSAPCPSGSKIVLMTPTGVCANCKEKVKDPLDP